MAENEAQLSHWVAGRTIGVVMRVTASRLVDSAVNLIEPVDSCLHGQCTDWVGVSLAGQVTLIIDLNSTTLQ